MRRPIADQATGRGDLRRSSTAFSDAGAASPAGAVVPPNSTDGWGWQASAPSSPPGSLWNVGQPTETDSISHHFTALGCGKLAGQLPPVPCLDGSPEVRAPNP